MKKFTIINLAVMLSAISMFAQTDEFKYRRSSLAMVAIESESFPNKDAVMNSWNNYPFPDKYNKHEIDFKSTNINAINLSDKELMNEGYLLDTLDDPFKIMKAVGSFKPVKYLNSDSTVALVLPTKKQLYQLKLNKVILNDKIANKLVARWFNLTPDGEIDFNLISERGMYNASDLEANIAEGSAKGKNILKDAGKELLNNTFVTFTKLDFVANEPPARYVRDIAKETTLATMASAPQMMIDKAIKKIDQAYDKAKEGYSLWSKTWLYQLNWNDSIYSVLQQQYKEKKGEAFNMEGLFSLSFVNVQYNQSLVTFKIGETRTEEQIIDLTLVRNLDNAFAKLQKKNDVFKPMIPVATSSPITAKIGMKEGIEGGDNFEVLEMIWDDKAGETTWKKVGKVSVDKKASIWDNRYNAGDEVEVQKDKKGNLIIATTFKGPKNLQPGMLLKQIK